jgi:hypothetical protein
LEDYLYAARLGIIFGLIAGFVVGILLFFGLRLVRRLRESAPFVPVFSDAKTSGLIAAGMFILVGVPFFGLGLLFGRGCATSDVYAYEAPGGRHKLVVYNFDCGATTDFSLNVSLLPADKILPKAGGNIYSLDHQRPDNRPGFNNFEVYWIDQSHVTVKLVGLGADAKRANLDGVDVSLERLN